MVNVGVNVKKWLTKEYVDKRIYIVLFVKASLMMIGVSGAYFYFHWYLERRNTNIPNSNTNIETEIY